MILQSPTRPQKGENDMIFFPCKTYVRFDIFQGLPCMFLNRQHAEPREILQQNQFTLQRDCYVTTMEEQHIQHLFFISRNGNLPPISNATITAVPAWEESRAELCNTLLRLPSHVIWISSITSLEAMGLFAIRNAGKGGFPQVIYSFTLKIYTSPE